MANKNRKPKSNLKNKNIIPAWDGWGEYFSSAEGRFNICTMLDRCMSHAHATRYTRQGELPRHEDNIEAEELAIELVAIDPDLKELIPEDVLKKIGDVDAAIDLARFADDPHLFKNLQQSVRTSIVLMSRGVSRVNISYTGGSDQCDPTGVEVIRSPIGSDKEVSYADGPELDSFMSAWGIDIDSFWMFCDDSGAGDGTGFWCAQVVAELMPEFHGYTTDPDFQEYDCDNCGEPVSQCSCRGCDSCGDMFTPEKVSVGTPEQKLCEYCRKGSDEADKEATPA